MAPIDYSKWDNIDADSEPEVLVLPQQAPARRSSRSTTPTESQGGAGGIQAVLVRCGAEKRTSPPWSATTIPADHPVFSQQVPPVPGLIDIPLVVCRMGTRSANGAGLDNQIATFLNMDAHCGFAPASWQSNVGTVLVARKDRKPLLPQHLEGVWMYCDHILDVFGEGAGAPSWLYNRPAFEQWWEGYCKEQKRLRSGKGGACSGLQECGLGTPRCPISLHDVEVIFMLFFAMVGGSDSTYAPSRFCGEEVESLHSIRYGLV